MRLRLLFDLGVWVGLGLLISCLWFWCADIFVGCLALFVLLIDWFTYLFVVY